MDNISQFLRPSIVPGNTKIRLGRNRDGGYIVSKELAAASYNLVSGGISDDMSFEDQFSQISGCRIVCYDHTIPRLPEHIVPEYRLSHVREALGIGKTVQDILSGLKRVTLKLDIEEYEYAAFYNKDGTFACLDNVLMLVLELHYPDRYMRNAMALLSDISRQMVLFHVHGNNYPGTFKLGRHDCPKCLELTFISKSACSEFRRDTAHYPVAGLDFPNNPNAPDIDLSFLTKCDEDAEKEVNAMSDTTADPGNNPLIKLLQPYDIDGLSKTRFGRDSNGGYVVPDELIGRVDTVVSSMYGCDMSFVSDFMLVNKTCKHIVHYEREYKPFNDRIQFRTPSLCGLHPVSSAIAGLKNVMLVVNIEGNEYDAFRVEPDNFPDLSDVLILVIELHGIAGDKYTQAIGLLSAIEKYMTLFHIHANAWGGYTKIDGHDVPNVVELTFVNNSVVKGRTPSSSEYPVRGLDVCCKLGGTDIPLTFV